MQKQKDRRAKFQTQDESVHRKSTKGCDDEVYYHNINFVGLLQSNVPQNRYPKRKNQQIKSHFLHVASTFQWRCIEWVWTKTSWHFKRMAKYREKNWWVWWKRKQIKEHTLNSHNDREHHFVSEKWEGKSCFDRHAFNNTTMDFCRFVFFLGSLLLYHSFSFQSKT